MRPDVGSIVRSWADDRITVWTETSVTQDFQAQIVKTNERTVRAMVQPAKATDIRIEDVDWLLDHQLVHTESAVAIGEKMTINSGTQQYIVIQVDKFGSYGFTESVVEELRV